MTRMFRSAFIGRIADALGQTDSDRQKRARRLFSDSPSARESDCLHRIRNRSLADRLELLDTLCAAAPTVNLTVVRVNDIASARQKILEIAAAETPEWGDKKIVGAWRHSLIDRLGLETALALRDISVIYPEGDPDKLKKTMAECFIGITSADYCLAETATLVMKTGPKGGRIVSLLPSTHIAVIEIDRLISNLPELYTLLRWHPDPNKTGLTNCLTFVTGPSKTADIEAQLVHGAHGPRKVFLLVIVNRTGDK